MFRFFVLLVFVNVLACVEAPPNPKVQTRHQYLLPADDFVITVKTDNGVRPPTEFTIPTSNEAIYNYDVDCNDDGIDEAVNLTGDYTCNYALLGGSGTYTIRIKNTFPRPVFGTINPDKLISVEQWGTQQWTTFLDGFRATPNLSINAMDTPDLSNVTDLEGMFRNSGVGKGSGNWNWNTTRITNMKNMFRLAQNFNKDINSWDVSNVTNMEGLFSANYGFNTDIGGWNVSKVTNMRDMFGAATEFNQDIGMWNVGAVENMESMFHSAEKFNHDVGGWDVSKVINFRNMFQRAVTFNQNISGWNVSSGINFERMLNIAVKFNQNLSSWNMSSAENVISMLRATNLSTINYDALLIGWSSQNLKPNLNFSVGQTNYCNGESARNDIVSRFNWSIFDHGKKCSVFVEMDANSEGAESSGGNLPMILAFGTLEVPTTVVVTDSNLGTARRDFDYRFNTPKTVTIPPGTYDGTRATGIAIPTLQILNDDMVEEDETIKLSVSQPTTNAELKDANGDGVIFTLTTYTILNDDICTGDTQCLGLKVCNLKQNPAQCAEPNTCGNGKLEAGEFCDDGNIELADGCNANCKIENGTQCAENDACASAICDATNATPVCESIDTCGNNIVETLEVCDDGNITNGDGCDENCKLEDNVECVDDALCASGVCDKSTTPGRCEPSNTCGNNIIEKGEACDDGGTIIGDGCDSLCNIEDAMNCVGDRNCPEGLACTDGVCGVECRSNSDCENGDCIFGQCVTCTQNTDCEGTDQCQSGSCVSSCTTNDECSPQGFCDQRCVECLQDEHCLENESCTNGVCDDPDRCDPNLETCENTCTSNATCTDARVPFCDPEGSICGECNDTEDCKDSEVCVPSETSNRCEPGCTEESCGNDFCGDDGLCAECVRDDDCESGRCNDSICVVQCQADTDCSSDLKKCDTDANICVSECTSDADCFLGTCTLETNKCEVEENTTPKDKVDEGCGCASSTPNIPLTPLIFCLFIAIVGVRRKVKRV